MFEIKVYIVMQRMNVLTPEGDNLRIYDVCLTASEAQGIVDVVPGTYIDRRRVTKNTPRPNRTPKPTKQPRR